MTVRSLQQEEAAPTTPSCYTSGTTHSPDHTVYTSTKRNPQKLPELPRALCDPTLSYLQPSVREPIQTRPPAAYPPGHQDAYGTVHPLSSSLPLPAEHLHTSTSYNNPAFGIPQNGKPHRARMACDPCRARKAKCDEKRPACGHCKETNLICVYKDVLLPKLDTDTSLILKQLKELKDLINKKMSELQNDQAKNGLQLSQLTNSALQEQSFRVSKDPSKKIPQHLLRMKNAEAFDKNYVRKANALGTNSNQIFVTGEDGELSIPIEHTTAAHKLLLWPSIKEIVQPSGYDKDYVMQLEEKRGLICVYGRGEDDKTSENPMVSVSTRSINTSAAIPEAYMHSPSPSEPWGEINQPQSKLTDVGLDDSGRVTTTPDTIRRYYSNYMEHFHKLHPFLDQKDLEQKIEWFIKAYCPGTGAEMPRGTKRKLSCDALQGAGRETGSPVTVRAETRSHIIEKSINNAIILLVLALGSICEVRDRPVPGPIMDCPSSPSMFSLARSDAVMASQANSFHSNPTSLKSSWMGDGRKNTAGRPYTNDQTLRNLDIIPGLAFYAYATGILGNLQGANGLYHVQAPLLAGLYAGQLAHPFQSYGWISQAARVCQILVRPKRYDKMYDGPMKDLYAFAYWTCLQLESDILAELDLPPSGISRFGTHVSFPKGYFTHSLPNEISAPETIMMFFYSAQIHLRKFLNRVHMNLYKADKNRQSHWPLEVLEILSTNLEQWRDSLPEIMKWKDSDLPSNDINVARMRAKYYGARYIIHRPLLYRALHCTGQSNARASSVGCPATPAAGTKASGLKSQQISPSMTHSQSATDMRRWRSETGPAYAPSPPNQTAGPGQCAYHELPKELRRACNICIESAIKSTEAFDGIKGRPILTNIFGTAHAQFGNMLVLSATYESHLSVLVNRNDLERLLQRTINFLLQSRYISPTLRADAQILTQIYTRFFGEPAGSFTSHVN